VGSYFENKAFGTNIFGIFGKPKQNTIIGKSAEQFLDENTIFSIWVGNMIESNKKKPEKKNETGRLPGAND
jgi:hypothetical protein